MCIDKQAHQYTQYKQEKGDHFMDVLPIEYVNIILKQTLVNPYNIRIYIVHNHVCYI